MAGLRATYRHPAERRYRRPGGPWTGPTLDGAVAAAGAHDSLVVDGDARLSAAEVEHRAAALAGGLRSLGVRRRSIVAWQLPNWHEAVLLHRACWRLGAVAAPLHDRAGAREVETSLEHHDPAVVLAAEGLPAAGWPAAVVVRGRDTMRDLFDAPPVHDPAARRSDLAAVLHTSGSTAGPKVVLHTHRTLAYKARAMAEVHGLGRSDAVLMPAPLAHISGLLYSALVPGVVPHKTVLMDRWDPDRALALIAAEEVTMMVGPPTYFTDLMAAPAFAPATVASLRLVSTGGAGVSPSFAAEAGEVLGAVVKRTYGSTEAPSVTTTPAGGDPSRAATTDGRPYGETVLRISDPDDHRELDAGSVGELWLRGPELFAGYADPAHTAAATHRGWFRTGDLASVDADGWLTVSGRVGDVIIRGGENISVAEIERVLEANAAVRQAVAVGEPDQRLGERVAAFVVGSEGFDLDACRTWFADQGVARFKWPERLVHVDRLPTLAAGKPDRKSLRALLA